jgi:glycosyltransferase involved in cell wall biosynthesis
MTSTKSVFVSFIVPHRNSFKDLLRCINSIPDNDEYELIIIDDNSDVPLDGEFLYGLKKRTRIKLFCQEAVQGAGFCRNVGIGHSSGEWVIFADADDYYLPSITALIQELVETSCDLHYFKVESRLSDSGELADRHLMWNEMLKFQNENDLRYGHVVPWGKIISRKLIEENSIFFDEIMFSNDITFSTKVGFFSKKIKIHDLICYCVTKQPNTLHSNFSGQAVFSRMIANLNRNLFLDSVHLPIYRMRISPFLKSLLKGGYLKFFLFGVLLLFFKYNMGKIHFLRSNYLKWRRD